MIKITLDLDEDTLAVIQAYLDEMKYEGTPEEYFEANCGRLKDSIIKDRWRKMNKGKTIEQRVAEIQAK